MIRLIAVTTLFLSLSAFGATVSIDPPNPDPTTPITIRVGGMWRDGCVPANPQIAISNNDVNFVLTAPGGICTGALTPFKAEGKIAALPPGVYRVRVTVSSVEIATLPFVVSDPNAKLSVAPNASPGIGV